LEAAAAGADGLGGHPEEQEARQRAIGVAADAVVLVVPARADREREEAVAPLPDGDVARVGVGQGDLDDLAGDEGAVEVAGLGVAQDGLGRVEDAVLGGREAPPVARSLGDVAAGRLHAILGLPRFSKKSLIASRRRSWTLEPSSRASCRSWREA